MMPLFPLLAFSLFSFRSLWLMAAKFLIAGMNYVEHQPLKHEVIKKGNSQKSFEADVYK
jgi:hypothetical protein